MGQSFFRPSGASAYCLRTSLVLAVIRGEIKQGHRTLVHQHCGLSRHESYCPVQYSLHSFPPISHQSLHTYPTGSQQTMISHVKARCAIYPRKNAEGKEIPRFSVPDDKVSWKVSFPQYAPVEFTAPSVACQPVWADKEDCSKIVFNEIDKELNVDRKTYTQHKIEVVDGRPRNVVGRTGVTGRGCLGRWGPNHAGDPIVTRWKRDDNNKKVKGADGKPILQFVAVQRTDNLEWALPGGMVNPGENRTATILREFGEEALNSLEASDKEKDEINEQLTKCFTGGHTVYEGYVDDPRNTDNAWMETKAMNFHDDEGNGLGAFNLNAGDDAKAAQWMDIDHTLNLYASHRDFIEATVKLLNAHW